MQEQISRNNQFSLERFNELAPIQQNVLKILVALQPRPPISGQLLSMPLYLLKCFLLYEGSEEDLEKELRTLVDEKTLKPTFILRDKGFSIEGNRIDVFKVIDPIVGKITERLENEDLPISLNGFSKLSHDEKSVLINADTTLYGLKEDVLGQMNKDSGSISNFSDVLASLTHKGWIKERQSEIGEVFYGVFDLEAKMVMQILLKKWKEQKEKQSKKADESS